ncbi:MAG: autotransporter-associated beta strand repeat-containing protein [Brevundimonas sp.]
MGSTALVAASLASGALAQTNPTGGGSISGSGSYTDSTSTGGGVQVTATDNSGITLNGVNFTNGTGSPTAHAYQQTAAGAQSAVLYTDVANSLTTTVTGGAALDMYTTANLTWAIGQFGPNTGDTLTGSYGARLTADGGFINVVNFQGSTSYIANGSAVAGLLATSSGGANLELGAVAVSGFSTGISANAGHALALETTGGAITGAVTGINAAAGGGVTLSIGGTIAASSAGVRATSTGGPVVVTVGADITAGGSAIYSSTGAAAGSVINVNADLTGSGLAAVHTMGQGYTVNVSADATVTASGTNSRAFISQSGDAVVVNQGTIQNLSTDANSAIQFAQAGSVTNSGSITTVGGAIGIYANTGMTVSNSGAIAAGGAGIYTGGNGLHVTTITNLAGGSIVGGLGGSNTPAIALFNTGAGTNTLDLQAGSTTGRVTSISGGMTTVNLAGAMTGDYTVVGGAGAVNFTLAATGEMIGATFGSAADTFTWQGGTISGVVNGGSGSDVFNSSLGTGPASLSLNSLTGFESYAHQAGDLTLTGSRTGGAGWTLVPGTSLTLDGSLSVTGTAISMNGNGDPATVSILTGSTLNGYTGVYFNTGGSHIFSNDGAITATVAGVFSNGGLSATNTGTITATTGAAFQFGFGASTVTNSGALTGGGDADTGFGVWSYNGATINNTGTITGGSGGVSSGRISSGTTYGGLLTITNGATGDITGDVGILTGGSSSLTLNNSGLVEGAVSGGVVANGSGLVSITNTAGGEILGVASGVAANGAATIINDGIITASATNVGTAGVVTGAGGSITNTATGVISGGFQGVLNTAGALTITNAGTITGGAPSDAIFSDGELTLVNTGIIEAHASGYSGVVFVGSGGSVVNAGLLRGGSNLDYGYGVQVGGATTAVSITNQSGGLIDGGVGAIRIHSNADVAIDLQTGSSTMGQIYSIGGGTITTNVAGVFNGAYNAAGGTGVDNLILAATGSMTGASLGAGDDSFAWQGGTFSGLINGGTGTDSFISNLGAGAGSVDLASFSDFESIIHQSGVVTLTGASASGAAEIHAGQGGPAGTLIFGAVTGLTGDIFVNGAVIRAESAGAFGTGAIHLINPTVSFGASGTYANDILLEVAAPASGGPGALLADAGVTATLTGAITQGAGPGVDPVQSLVIGGAGRIILTNTANLWTGTTTVSAGATLQGATDTISGSSVVADGVLDLVQATSGVFTRDVSGGGIVQISGLGADQILTLSGDLTNAFGVRVVDAGALSLTGSVTTVNASAVTLNSANLAGVTSQLTNSGAVSGVFAINAVGGLDLTNSGSIAATSTDLNSSGIYVGGAGVIDNSGSIIATANAIFTQGVGDVSNSGLIRGGGASTVRLFGAGSRVTNLAGGLISAAASGTGVYLDGADATVVNAGGISGGNAGVTLLAGGEVTNTATGQITGGNHGLVVYGTAHVTNMASGVMRGDIYNAVYAGGDGTTVANAGLMEGGNAAIYLNGADTVINNSGVIRVTGTTAPTVISGIYVSGAGAAITNSGAIESGLADGRGIFLAGGGGSIDNLSGGVISGDGDGAAILLTGADYVLNLRQGSTVNGLIDASATTGLNLVSIAGDLNGAYVGGSGADQLSLLGGGAFGILLGGDGVDSLLLTGADDGALDIGLVAGFETRVLDGSGVWTLTGADAETVGWTLDAGTLRLTGGMAANDLGAIQVNAGGVLSVGDSEGIGTLTGSGSVSIDDGAMLFVGLDDSDSLFSGIVSGQGGLGQSGDGTLILTGTNTYTGWTSVEAGVLQLGAAGVLADESSLSVGEAGVLDLQAFDETVALAVIHGTVSGSGVLTAARYELDGATIDADLGDGVLLNVGGVSTLNGAALTQTVVVQGGTLALGGADRLSDTATVQVDAGASLALQDEIERIGALFGGGRVDVGAGRLVFGGPDSAFDGVLTGLGEVEHTAGVFTLMGSHDIGSILNSGGELRYLAETSGSVSVTGGTLTGAGTIGGALTLGSGVVLSPGIAGLQNGVGSFSVGSLVMNGGTLALDVLSVDQGELIDGVLVTGVADLRGGFVDPTFQGEASDFNFATRYVFLQAGDLVGRFANGGDFTASGQEGIYWRVRYDLLADAAVIELRQLIDFDPGPAGSDNARSVAAMLSAGQLQASDDFSAVLELMADLDADGRTAAFDSMSGEGLVSVGAAFHTADDAFLRTVWASGGSAPGSAGMSGGGAGRLGQSLAALEPGVGSPASGGWATVYTSERTLDGAKAGQASVQTRLEGAAGGYSLALGPVTLGAAGGVSNLEGEVDQRGARYDSNVTHVGAFARYATGGWTLDLTGTHFSGDVDTNRWIEIGGYAGQASGLTQAEGGSVALRLSHRFDLSADTRLILGAAAAAGRSEVDAFTEQGAGGLSLEVAAQDREWRSVQLGVRGEHSVDLGEARVNLYAGLAGLGQVGETAAIGDMRLTGAASGFGDFRVEGAATPSAAAQLEFGAETTVEQGVTFSVGYRGLVSDRLQDHAVGAGLRLRW